MKNKRELKSYEVAILNCLPQKKPVLKKDSVSRKDISKITGIPLREVSSIIEKLREEYPICSSRGLRGYWLGNKEEALAFAKECRNHANGLINTAKNIEEMFSDDQNLLVFE